MGTLKYCTISDLNTAILRNIYKFPHDIDLIVGIPRSGMLPANLIALYMNKKYTDISSFCDGKVYATGERGEKIDSSKIKKVLVVDDSVHSGKALNKAKSMLACFNGQYDFKYAAIYARSYSTDQVDIYCEIIDEMRIFQWNLFHHNYLSNACIDIDGVLCLDPPVDDDGPLYREYIKNAVPFYLPTVEIGTIVTCRLEKYREETEAWLKKYNIKYKKLVMLNLETKQDRISWGRHGDFKGEIYKNSSAILFIESSIKQARQINRVSGKPVICTENFEIFDSNIEIEKSLFAKLRKKIHNKMWMLTH